MRTQPFKDHPITRAVKDKIALALVMSGLCACHDAGVTASAPSAASSPSDGPASLYRLPPAATSASLLPGARVRLEGRAEPGTRIRLASPAGQAAFAETGPGGAWRLDLPAATAPRLFGLAMIDQGRAVQAEGYIAVTPGGVAAQLRAGAGALVVGDVAPSPVILAVDYDSKGGAVVSGRATPRAALDIRVDGVSRGRGPAAADGLFSVALGEPLAFVDHRFELVDGARQVSAQARMTLAAPLAGGPYRATRTPTGWRIDWMTPGGGLQTTLLLSHEGANA